MALTSTRLLVLGAVRGSGPIHGYDVRRKLLSWEVDKWANVAPGSIYNALRTLTREGLLEIVGTGRQGARPERTTYQFTADGEKEFQQLLRDHVWHSRLPHHPLLVGLAFFRLLPREEFLRALTNRADELQAETEFLRSKLAMVSGGENPASCEVVPFHVAESLRLVAALTKAEATWTRDIADRVRAGDFDDAWHPSALPVP
jgi:DNA-binding PadR family transcriptional regulator